MILLLCGRKHSGKDTTARLLTAELGFKPLSFAGSPKDFTAEMLGVPREWMEEKKEAVIADLRPEFLGIVRGSTAAPHLALRWFLQHAGSAARKVFGEDFWIDRVVAQMTAVGARFVISDGRYFNEVEGLREVGAKIIRLNRADRWESHRFAAPDVPVPVPDHCAFSYAVKMELKVHFVPCDLPAHSHPTSWSADRHPSEVELPDSGDIYDAVIGSPSAEETARIVLEKVRSWL